jgi:hypothetical protein
MDVPTSGKPYRMMMSDVDACMVHNFDEFKRLILAGKHPSIPGVMAAISTNCLDAVRLYFR